MKFAASVKKVIAFLLCLALLTSDVTVTNATSVDTTDVFAEISTEMLNETKNAGQESTGQEGKVSDPDGTGNTEKVRNTENSESTKVTNNIGNAIGTEAVEGTEAIENTEVTDDTESTETTEAVEETEETEQPELKTVFDYSNDAVRVVVTLSNETDLPAGAELVVAPVAVTAEMEASIDKAMEGESKEKEEVVASPL